MGQVQSQIEDTHVRMYQNLLSIKSPATRMQMIQTLLSSPEHLASARIAGVYGHLLHYTQQVKEGRKAPFLPGEIQGQGQGQGQQQQQQQLTLHSSNSANSANSAIHANQKGNDRAMNYFSACLRILGLEEEVALTEEALKGAYKKAVVRAHPDKGGSEKEFEAVTRAYAYLGEILKRIHGGRSKEGKVEAPSKLTARASEAAEAWKMVEPIQLNPAKLNLESFNTMFEKTRIPDPEESGYGDWLKTSDESRANKFGGKFNREVFHKTFEEDNRSAPRATGGAIVAQELSLASRMGYATELGRTGRDDYTVAANEAGIAYTDLKKAYTEYNTFSHQTAGIRIDNRNLDEMAKERKTAPAPLADSEMAALRAAEASVTRGEEQRKMRVAQEAIAENNYFERMKRLVIRNG